MSSSVFMRKRNFFQDSWFVSTENTNKVKTHSSGWKETKLKEISQVGPMGVCTALSTSLNAGYTTHGMTSSMSDNDSCIKKVCRYRSQLTITTYSLNKGLYWIKTASTT